MKILIPTDFSQCAEKAMQYGFTLAQRLGASVVLLNSYIVPMYPEPESEMMGPDRPTLVAQTAAEARSELEAARQRLAPQGLLVETRAAEGMPAEAIVAAAKEEGCEMIVMGTHGRTGFKHLMLGSVAEQVVRAAPCPVLTVRAAEH
jgi:nucleotide-binding universal stress UspA family protein